MAESPLSINAVGREAVTKALPLTWAQTNMWRAVVARGGPLGFSRQLDLSRHLEPGVTVERAAAGISRFVSAYDIARTTFDPAQRMQLVQSEMAIPVAALDMDAAVSQEAFGTMARSLFSVTDEPPIRFGLLVKGDEVHSVVLVLSHLAFDAASWRPVARLMLRAFDGTVSETLQPEKLVRFEESDRMQEHSNAALRRWTDTLLTLPAGGGYKPYRSGRFTEWQLKSRAIAIAAQTIAVGAAVSTTSAILAALTTILRSSIADPPSAMLLICSNRHHADLAEYAGIALQNALYVIPQRERRDDFVEYVKSVHMSAIRGYVRARYDTTHWQAMLAEMKALGTAPDLSYFFNDARLATDPWEGLDQQIDSLRTWSRSDCSAMATVVGHHDRHHPSLFLNLRDAGPTARIDMTCDDATIPPAQAVAILHELEELLVSRALALLAR